MQPEQTDADAIRASLADPDAFEVLFRRYYQPIRGYLQRRIGADVGEELAAQTFIVAFDNRVRYDPSHASARPWLFAIATNLLRHHLRDEGRHLRLLAGLPPARDAQGVEDDRLTAIQLQPLLAAALAHLDGADRDAIMLFAVADLSYEEVAAALRIPTGTVRSKIHRARRLLREQLPSLGAIRDVDEEGPAEEGATDG